MSAVTIVFIITWSDILTSGTKHTTRVGDKRKAQGWRALRIRWTIASCETASEGHSMVTGSWVVTRMMPATEVREGY